MAKLTTTTISRRTVDALAVAKDTVFWDSELSGFGVRVYPSGSKVYVVQTRAGGGPAKRVTVGRHGVVTAEEARRRAALVIARIKAGEEPLPETPARVRAAGPTVGELARQWLDGDVAVHCKPRTAKQYAQIVERHILPRLGRVPAAALDHAQVAALHHALRATPPTANRTVAVLARIWNAAEDRGLLPEGGNPCRLVVRNRERPRERFLSEAEFRRLGRTLAEAETRPGVSVHAVAAIRLLLLTGCRKNEILTLRWADVDLAAGELRLGDTKTGPRVVPLSPEAVAVLAGIARIKGNPHVIPVKVEGAPLRNLDNLWRRIRARAGLGDVRLHDCRHSFASRALALGEGLPMIGRLLGHARVETTARYAHLARDSVRQSAERVSDSIAEDVLGHGWRDAGGEAAAALTS
ncbi:MAG: site-specific integrase [Rhodospirillales bacterium]|nr:site-specific integrase [Rhodospirillales bacterium]